LDDTHGGCLTVKYKVDFHGSQGAFTCKEVFNRRAEQNTHNIQLPIPGDLGSKVDRWTAGEGVKFYVK
jgi:hypothetical protein